MLARFIRVWRRKQRHDSPFNPSSRRWRLVFPRVRSLLLLLLLLGSASTSAEGGRSKGAARRHGWICRRGSGFQLARRNDVFAGRRRKPITCPTGCHHLDRYTTKPPPTTHRYHHRRRLARNGWHSRRRRPPVQNDVDDTDATMAERKKKKNLLADRWIRQTDFEAGIIYGLDWRTSLA